MHLAQLSILGLIRIRCKVLLTKRKVLQVLHHCLINGHYYVRHKGLYLRDMLDAAITSAVLLIPLKKTVGNSNQLLAAGGSFESFRVMTVHKNRLVILGTMI